MNNAKYYYGWPKSGSNWSSIADIFAAHESVNSAKTSSIPLFSFWRPSGLSERIRNVNEKYDCISDASNFCFEYAVPVNKDCHGRGKSSMTDLMIFSRKHVIAIEGKYTECRQSYQSIIKWRGKKAQTGDNKYKVLEGWLKYIQDAQKTNLKGVDEICESDIPYQLVHRVASACKAAKDNNQQPVVIYHLFYDECLCEKKDEFCKMLKHALYKLKLKNLPFLIMETFVKPSLQQYDRPVDNTIFLEIVNNASLYEFGETVCDIILQ